jgi:DNA polymerase-3 subunit gamma/tau
MEEPPANVKFILCTTEPHKVPATIQSRCQRFDFHSIPSSRIAAHLSDVLAKEGITADDAVVSQVARLANGSMRDGLSLMDRLVSAAQGHVSAELAREVLGLPDDELLDALVEAIAGGQPQHALAAGAALLERGMSPDHALETLAARLRDSMMLLVCGAETELVDVAPETRSRLRSAVGSFDVPGLVHLITLCDATSRTIRNSSIPRALFDAALVRLALAEHFANAAALLSGTRGTLPRAPDPKA